MQDTLSSRASALNQKNKKQISTTIFNQLILQNDKVKLIIIILALYKTGDMQTKNQQYIEFNQDFSNTIFMKNSEIVPSPSPMPGVVRYILERTGDQVARRATSIVTYVPNSSFSSHTHPYGQQFFVLQGTFSDQSGDYSKGWYVRNPIKSAHAPFSKEGTRIFVKLGQMALNQYEYLRLNTNIIDFTPVSPGVTNMVLFQSHVESVYLYKLDAGAKFTDQSLKDCAEIINIEGIFKANGIQVDKQSWIRIPKGEKMELEAIQASKLYMKIGKGVVRDKQWNELTF